MTLDGRIELLEVVGRGANGLVWRARLDGRIVAVKDMPLVHPDAKLDELAAREAKVLFQLDHPQVVEGIESLAHNGRFYLVQEFIEGPTLAEEMEGHRYEVDEVLAIVEDLLGVLAYLHTRSPPVIHRDLKPSNVIRTERGLVLVDFGSVRDALRDKDLGGSTVAGTFGFMAPEQLRGDASPATDIYGVAALAVALLSRQDPARLMDWSGDLKWSGALEVHHAVHALLERMLKPDPDSRPSDAAALAREVASLREALRTGVGLPAKRPAPPRASRLGLLIAGALAVLIAVLIATAGAGYVFVGTSTQPPAPVVVEAIQAPPVEVVEVAEEPLSDVEPSGVAVMPDGRLLPLVDEEGAVSMASNELMGMRTAFLGYEAAFDEYPASLPEAGWEPSAKSALWLAFAVDGDWLQAVITRGPGRGRLFSQKPSERDQFEGERLDDDGVADFLALPTAIGNSDTDTWMPEAEDPKTEMKLEGGVLVPQLDENGVLTCVYDELSALEDKELRYDAAFDEFTESFEDLGYQTDAACAHYVSLGVDVAGPYKENVTLSAEVIRGATKGERFTLVLGENVVAAP